jgi:structural maintenance of chromosome 4
LQADYEEREKTYKQLKAMVADVSKDLAKEEKKQVSLEEKVKHAKTKTKKLKKTISEVRPKEGSKLTELTDGIVGGALTRRSGAIHRREPSEGGA